MEERVNGLGKGKEREERGKRGKDGTARGEGMGRENNCPQPLLTN